MFRIDSVDKIIQTYLACITKEPFEYKGIYYNPRPLRVSGRLFNGFTCPNGCGGCCPKFSLDYLPGDFHPYPMYSRMVRVKEKDFLIFTDWQEDNTSLKCHNLQYSDGRCTIHGKQPFSCDFELIRFSVFENGNNQLGQRLFGRGWSYTRTDGGTGAKCELTPVTSKTIKEVVRKLGRLKQWAEHFELVTHIDSIIEWAGSAPHIRPLYLNQEYHTHGSRQSSTHESTA